MHVLVDIKIVLDVLCNRQPFASAAQSLWIKVEAGEVRASLIATSVSTIYYLARKQLGREPARRAVADLLATFEVLAVDRAVLQAALARPMADFEDAIAGCGGGTGRHPRHRHAEREGLRGFDSANPGRGRARP